MGRSTPPSPDCPPRSRTDGALSSRGAESSGKSRSLPREAVVVWETAAVTPAGRGLTQAEKNRCASMDHILTRSDPESTKAGAAAAVPPTSVSRLQRLIDRKLEETEQLLAGVRKGEEGGAGGRGKETGDGSRSEAERLLQEARLAWNQALEVLEEVKNLRGLCQQLDSSPCPSPCPTSSTKGDSAHRSPK